eukprot:5714477-Amphidinium_carterae.1
MQQAAASRQQAVLNREVKPDPIGKPDDKALPGSGEPGGEGESDPYIKPASCGAWLKYIHTYNSVIEIEGIHRVLAIAT